MKQPLRAVLYTRVSTDEQAEKGTSLAGQLVACENKARQIGAEVVAVYTDAGVSGALYATREGIQSALRDLEAGKANVLIALDVSRVSRDREHQSKIKKRAESAGAQLVFAEQTFENTVEGEFMFNVVGDVADYYRRLLRQKSMQGKRNRAAEGKQPARCWRPFGYHIVSHRDVDTGAYPQGTEGTYVLIESEAALVGKMFTLYLQGASLGMVGDWLAAEGATTTQGSVHWDRNVVRRLLQNPVYKGQPIYGKESHRRAAEDSTKKRMIRENEPSEWIVLSAPAIVSEAVWNAVQEKIKTSRSLHSGRRDRRYALSGLLRCPHCKRGMGGRIRNGKLYYRCRFIVGREWERTCDYTQSLTVTQAEEMVTRAIETAAANPEMIEKKLRAYQDALPGAYDAAEAKRLHRRLMELDAAERRVVELQIKAAMDGLDATIYTPKLKEFAQEKATLTAHIQASEATRQQQTPQVACDTAALLAQASADLHEVLTAPESEVTGAEKHDALTKVVEKITIEDDALRVWLKESLCGMNGVTVTRIRIRDTRP